MPTRQLPPELLIEIFSNLTSSPTSLFYSLPVSRTFCRLIKPILYRHITITSNEQCELLLRVKKEDKQRVKHITIIGEDGSYDPSDAAWHDEECALGEGVIIDLLRGKLLDISVIETLHVKDVHEHTGDEGTSKDWARYRYLKTAFRLTELSISGHQGGGLIWEAYLRRQYVPNLKRLAYADVGTYEDAREGLDDDEWPDTMPYLSEETHYLGKAVPYSQLEVLVAYYPEDDSDHPIRTFPSANFLCLPSWSPFPPNFREINTSVKHLKLGYSQSDSRGLIDWTTRIERRFETEPNTQVDVHLWLSGRPTRLSPEDYQDAIDRIKAKGFLVHGCEDEPDFENSTSLIFPSFVDYLKKNGKCTRAPKDTGVNGVISREMSPYEGEDWSEESDDAYY
ncbi:hypothetical protein JCM3765_005825 [Sporobolomyces pararoseus]